VADEHRRWQLEIVDKSQNVPGGMLDRAFVRSPGCRAMATQIAGNDFMNA
jgi:hypothetical protein